MPDSAPLQPSQPPPFTAASRPLLLSVDLEEWFHGRWATGYAKSQWGDTATLFREVYGSDRPRGDVIPAVHWLLDFFARHQVRATFFILGEIAQWYPDLIRAVAAGGHEIACHGLHHVDMGAYTPQQFAADLARARSLLEDLGGKPVRGFRSPNLVVAPWLAGVLGELGFAYDSSVCPSLPFRGKYADMGASPQHPYRTADRVQTPGAGPLWELPITSMPGLRLTAGSAIATRVFGQWWSRFALAWWGRSGSVQYYLHPYEIWTDTLPGNLKPWARLMTRRRGPYLQRALDRLVTAWKPRGILTCGACVDRLIFLEQKEAKVAKAGLS